MTIEEAIKIIDSAMTSYGEDAIDYDEVFEAKDMAIRSLEAWEKIDDDIASLQDMYSIGGTTETEKAIWENLQAVRKTIHKYLKEVSE